MGERARSRVLGAYTIIHYEATLLRALGCLVTPALRDRTTEPSVCPDANFIDGQRVRTRAAALRSSGKPIVRET